MAKKTKTELSSPKEQELKTASYRLKALMNVRKLPSLEAEIVAHAQKDTIVDVFEIVDDWMKIRWYNGFAYILFDGGKFAEAARG